jgi:hypothetical protein
MRVLLIVLSDDTSVGARGVPLDSFACAYYVLRDAPADVVLASESGGYLFLDVATTEGVNGADALRRFRVDRFAREDLADTLCFDDIDVRDFDGGMCIGPTRDASSSTLSVSRTELILGLLSSGKPVVIVPEQLAPTTAGSGLLITGNLARSPIIAAHALIGALRQPFSVSDSAS